MGDYTKMIVSCVVEIDKKELEEKIEELGLHSSAYHSQEVLVHIQEDLGWHHRESKFGLVMSGQTKWGAGQQEFLEWLRKFVIQGSGEGEVYAFQIWESGDIKIWKLNRDVTVWPV